MDPQQDPAQLARIYDQAIQDKETLHRWEAEQDHEFGTDTERAVKLAAIRTEMLRRAQAALDSSE